MKPELILAEKLREISLSNIFQKHQKFIKNWPNLEKGIKNIIGKNIKDVTGEKIFNLTDDLRQIFFNLLPKDSKDSRSQSNLAIAGEGWERITTWYLNLCLINTRAVVFKFKQKYFSEKILDSVTVNINGNPILSEPDLIAVILPENTNLNLDEELKKKRNKEDKILEVFKKFSDENYKNFEIVLIQCKTNFADDVERPLLYQILFNLPPQLDIGIKIGINGMHVNNFKKFKYCFVTTPSQKDERIAKKDSAPVVRSNYFSGGVYWGIPTRKNVAASLKEIFKNNFSSVLPQGDSTIKMNLDNNLTELQSKYKYFKLNY